MERGAVPLRLQPAASSYNLPFTHQPRLIMPIIDLPMLTTSALDHGLGCCVHDVASGKLTFTLSRTLNCREPGSVFFGTARLLARIENRRLASPHTGRDFPSTVTAAKIKPVVAGDSRPQPGQQNEVLSERIPVSILRRSNVEACTTWLFPQSLCHARRP